MNQEDLKGQSTSIISWYGDIEFDGELIILTLSLTHHVNGSVAELNLKPIARKLTIQYRIMQRLQ